MLNSTALEIKCSDTSTSFSALHKLYVPFSVQALTITDFWFGTVAHSLIPKCGFNKFLMLL